MPNQRSDETPVTQIISFVFETAPTSELQDTGDWAKLLDIFEQTPGLQRIYWGRSHEHPEYAQLHIVRQTLQQHHLFLGSSHYQHFLQLLAQITNSSRPPTIRHARLQSWSPSDPSLGRGAPFTGTAIYLNTTDAWDEGAWPLWTHTVRHIDGCLGGAGGPLLEPVETIQGPLSEMISLEEPLQRFERCNIVFVAWETTEKHHEYHHTQHWKEHGVILRCGNEGFAEYGHVAFEGAREYALGEKRPVKL